MEYSLTELKKMIVKKENELYDLMQKYFKYIKYITYIKYIKY